MLRSFMGGIAISLAILSFTAARLDAALVWGRASGVGCITNTTEGTRFQVEGRGATFCAPLPGGVDLAKKPWIMLRYRAFGAVLPPDYLLRIGGNGISHNVFRYYELAADGAWRTLIARAESFVADQVNIQLQSDGPAASMEISRLEFMAEQPTLTPGELLDCGLPAKGEFQEVSLADTCNSNHDGLASGLNLAGWFSGDKATVLGVPFKLVQAKSSVVSSSPDVDSKLRIPLTGLKGTEVFVLAAVTPGWDLKMKREVFRQPDRFSACVSYVTGPDDEFVPARLGGGFGLVRGFGVYAVAVSPGRCMKELVIRENVPGLTLSIVGVTVGSNTRIAAHAHPRPASEPKPYSPIIPYPAGKWNTTVSPDGGQIDLTSGGGRVTLSLQPGVSMEVAANNPGPHITSGGSLWTVAVDGQILASVDFVGTARATGGADILVAVSDRKGLGVGGLLRVSPLDEGRIEMKLQLATPNKRRLQVVFPTVGGIKHGDGGDLAYCFPRRGAVVGRVPIELMSAYSGMGMPLQFMDVYGTDGGLYLLTKDVDAVPRQFVLRKEAGKVGMEVAYDSQESFESVSTVLGFHSGDWHAALDAYKKWVTTWLKTDAPLKDWFREVFTYRQIFMRFYDWDVNAGGRGYYNPDTKKYTFLEGLAKDEQAFGKIDYLHIIDALASGTYGRCGDYAPWDEIGGLDAFRKAVQEVQASGTRVGVYMEGYIVDGASRVFQSHGLEWARWAVPGQPVGPCAAADMCSLVPQWQNYLAAAYKRVRKETGIDGYYVDQIGFAHKGCWSPNHGHAVPGHPLRGERELMRKIRAALDPQAPLLSEENPIDASTIHQDGSLTQSSYYCREDWSPLNLNLTRFALPHFKTFEYLLDDPFLAGNGMWPIQLDCVRRVFFNGEATWICSNPDIDSPEVLAFIRHMHGVMKKYAECFTSLSPVPNIPTGQPSVLANEFPSEERTLWTLFNATYSTVRGEMLAIRHLPGARYHDAWNGCELKPRIADGLAYIELALGPRDVGCVVRDLVSQHKRLPND